MHKTGVHEVLSQDRPATTKIAPFAWDVKRIDNETWVCSIITHYQQKNPGHPPIGPSFLARLTENGHVTGLLLEKLDGDFASINDLPECDRALRQMHGMGLVHGDVNRYDFVVDGASGHVRMLDFEHAEDFDEKKARLEIESLSSELCEGTGRGKGFLITLRWPWRICPV